MKFIYDHNKIEENWQAKWEEWGLFQDSAKVSDKDKEKMYLLFAFAYPSGQGLHVGHVESKTALDILARFNRMQGKDVFFPVGWDAFGLPAENYAIKTGVHPTKTTTSAINTFRRQIKRLGISYDWANEIATCNPGYYKWTQWLFLELYKKGLAYKKPGLVNWCPSCQTVLANEQVVQKTEGETGVCERCETAVIQKEMKQWYFKITEYAQELVDGLSEVDWPRPTKDQQLHWIGRKEGINITYSIKELKEEVVCFTTRPDTNFGASFIVISPEHPLVEKIIVKADEKTTVKINQYVQKAQAKKDIERLAEGKKKTGVFTQVYAQHPLTDEKLPIYVSDFVLMNVGTGAVVGVPGHDERDFDFAKAFDLPIKRVVVGSDGDESDITSLEQVQEKDGVMINSSFLDGVKIKDAIEKMKDHLEEKGSGKRVVTYRLRDWLISRQRYWGTPIPVVYDPEGKAHVVKEEHLPWVLPEDVDYNPKGKSPLGSSKELFARTEKLYGKGWTPEVDTMDTFVDSSWYFLRYLSSRDETQFVDPKQAKHWLPVDLYMIGPEHIVLHLLYARFFTKFLRDQGHLKFNEPFAKMRHQGMILGPDGKKMSKSKGNVINPDDVVDKFGADTLRMYEMFMGPLEADKPWDISAVAGVYRFLNRVFRLCANSSNKSRNTSSVSRPGLKAELHRLIKKVTQDIPKLKFNTAIAAMMSFVNLWEAAEKDGKGLSREEISSFIRVLAPFAPFMAEEIWSMLSGKKDTSIHLDSWPEYDESLIEKKQLTIPVQIDGKIRDKLVIDSSQADDQEKILTEALGLEKVKNWVKGKEIKHKRYVVGKIVSFATGGK